MNNVNIVTYNVRGLGNHNKRRQVFHYLNKKSHSIIFLQETHSISAIEKRWYSEWGGLIY